MPLRADERRAESEAERARMESTTANRVKEFVIDVFTVADPEEGGGESVTNFVQPGGTTNGLRYYRVRLEP